MVEAKKRTGAVSQFFSFTSTPTTPGENSDRSIVKGHFPNPGDRGFHRSLHRLQKLKRYWSYLLCSKRGFQFASGAAKVISTGPSSERFVEGVRECLRESIWILPRPELSINRRSEREWGERGVVSWTHISQRRQAPLSLAEFFVFACELHPYSKAIETQGLIFHLMCYKLHRTICALAIQGNHQFVRALELWGVLDVVLPIAPEVRCGTVNCSLLRPPNWPRMLVYEYNTNGIHLSRKGLPTHSPPFLLGSFL